MVDVMHQIDQRTRLYYRSQRPGKLPDVHRQVRDRGCSIETMDCLAVGTNRRVGNVHEVQPPDRSGFAGPTLLGHPAGVGS